ncbi:MAG: carbohydrate ABC transporter substrate-binding protein [Actinomycetales bacterium]|nr:carbohydrate ABC transporter substrate-binding protein [Actinomycetales bacterium]
MRARGWAARRNRRSWAAVAALASAVLLLTSCGYPDNLEEFDPEAGDQGCEEFAQYGKFKNTTVDIFSSIREIEAERFENSFLRFEYCTGIQIKWEGTGQFEDDLAKRIAEGKPPDLAPIAQPGLITALVRQGAIKRPSRLVTAQSREKFSADWLRYGTVDGTFYAPPLGANVKSFVWYSPDMFSKYEWKVPESWAELKVLTEKIAKTTKIKPWCAGIFSPPGDASGWPGTDWVEDVILRTSGVRVYDAWTEHRIPFNDKRIIDSFDETGSILRNPRYVNGDFGGVKSINDTSWMEAGTPILDQRCALHRAASFYINQWPPNTRVAEDGDVFAFYLPSRSPRYKPVLGGGEFLSAFNVRKETQAVQLYLTSDEWINAKAKAGYWISPSRGLLLDSVENPIDQLSVKLLQDEKAVFRFDASDLMPSDVGAGSFWKGMIEWIGGRSTYDTLTTIETSWPTS